MRIKPKKRLGQNFLVDKNIQRKIIQALNLNPADLVLEIGAGRGEITSLVAKEAGWVYALEIDSSLLGILAENLKGMDNVQVINQDILKFDLKKYFKNEKGNIKVVGNIPYYISSAIIEYLFKYRDKMEFIFITVQKEFAQRVAAPPGSKDYGSLSCFVQYYSCPKILFEIKKNCFFPVPKVDSCLLRMDVRNRTALTGAKENEFFKIVRAAFNKRRKTLRNSLDGIVPQEKLDDFFSKFNIDINIRPEDLSVDDFIKLTKLI